ncbi:MAG: 16S rRNA (adenine(1518)-N(6)/adenine(1519)-N(6))-dimethyltransferase, partial [Proteobacteria bacterium]|nr:16S rRNA (adenine(1518)-N(6)/adenine(1519)-N(6))-dimethyltransferase [Pseudomonadota bacterium]
VVKAAFSARRKTLLNSLAGGLGLPKARARAVIDAAGIDPGRRAETLSPPEFAALARGVSGLANGPRFLDR